MKRISEEEIIDLHKKGRVKTEDGKELTFPPSFEERQVAAIEKIVSEMTLILKANDKNTEILVGMINKLKIPDIKIPDFPVIKIPDFPKPTKKWKFSVSRNDDDFIKEITAEAE